jgi:exopolysaccharide production protein ExoZ
MQLPDSPRSNEIGATRWEVRNQSGMVFNVQVLRGIAATLVVWVHAQELVASDILPHWSRSFGYGGVDLFFVISGFIMVRTTQDKDTDALTFFRKRIFRVAPLYYSATLLVVALSVVVPQLMESTQPEFDETVKSLLFVPFEKTPDRVYPVYYLGWTLNYEMFFYALFGASLFLPRRFRPAAIIAAIASLAVAGSFIGSVSEHGVAAYFYTRPIMLDFALGVLVAACLHTPSPLSKPLFSWIFIASGVTWFVFGGGMFRFGNEAAAPPTDTFLRFGIPAALIVAGAVGLEKSGKRVGNSLMRRCGDASYSLYLSHYFFVGAVIAAAARLEMGDTGRIVLAAFTMAAAIGLGFAVYHLVERPLAGDVSAYRSVRRQMPLRQPAR